MKHTCSRLAVAPALMVFALASIGNAHGQDVRVMAGVATVPVVTVARSCSVPITPTESWPCVGNEQLNATRGGFDAGSGLVASFGFDRVVYINGNLVAHTSVNIPDVGQMTAAQASALAVAVGTSVAISNGPGNSFDTATLTHATAATVIQNTLDNQHIQSLTTINAAVNSLNTFHNLNLQDSLQAGLIGSLAH